MTNKKLCPLRKINSKVFDHCYREKCAWYDNYEEECVITSIERDLDLIRTKLHQIKEQLEK